jgi:hypothetical protein
MDLRLDIKLFWRSIQSGASAVCEAKTMLVGLKRDEVLAQCVAGDVIPVIAPPNLLTCINGGFDLRDIHHAASSIS